MNILNLTYSLNVGGIEKLLVSTSNELVNNNTVYVCVISSNYSKELVDEFDERVHVLFLNRHSKWRGVSYIAQLMKLIKAYRIDVLHIHQAVMMVQFLPIYILCPTLKEYVTIHDAGLFKEIGKLNRFCCKHFCRRVIAISDGVKRDIISYGVPEAKVRRIHNGINLDNFQLKCRTDNFEEQVLTVGNVARFMPPKKGQDILIKAIGLLKKKGYMLNCKFAGGAVANGEHYFDDMRSLAAEQGVSEQIEFLGNVTDVPAFLKELDIFVMPSRYEGFGISVIEALATGIPCVTSNVYGLNEIVTERYCGEQFAFNDVSDLADKLEVVINNVRNYNPKALRKMVEDRFSIQKMCKELQGVYGE